MHRTTIATAALLAATLPVPAAEISITVPDATDVERREAVYDCGEHEVPVEYVNAWPVALAILSLDGTTIVASNVLSGSGAKYAGAQYVWWSKGNEALLFDLMQGEDAAPVTCNPLP